MPSCLHRLHTYVRILPKLQTEGTHLKFMSAARLVFSVGKKCTVVHRLYCSNVGWLNFRFAMKQRLHQVGTLPILSFSSRKTLLCIFTIHEVGLFVLLAYCVGQVGPDDSPVTRHDVYEYPTMYSVYCILVGIVDTHTFV